MVTVIISLLVGGLSDLLSRSSDMSYLNDDLEGMSIDVLYCYHITGVNVFHTNGIESHNCMILVRKFVEIRGKLPNKQELKVIVDLSKENK